LAFLERGDPPDVEAHGRGELERAPAGRGLGVAEHHADLLAEVGGEGRGGAWLVGRAWRRLCVSPISPSTWERGTSAATESTTSTSTAPERISTSAISSACSPLSGCETSRLSMSTPSLPA